MISNSHLRWWITAVLLLSLVTTGAAAQAINVTGSFEADLTGYDSTLTPSDRSHVIQVDGEIRTEGENAQDVVISIEPSDSTIIDPESVTTFVEGDQEVSFEQTVRTQEVRLRTEEIPGGTTVLIEYQVVFIGGSTSDEINAATLEMSYQSSGGTSGSETFDAKADMSGSADNQIMGFENEEQMSLAWRLAGWVGIGGIVLLILTVVLSVAGVGGGGGGTDL